tara:strand:+ start:874 stop:978 length:105 start_codon:yes stop_codon:yes gene_type:complete
MPFKILENYFEKDIIDIGNRIQYFLINFTYYEIK